MNRQLNFNNEHISVRSEGENNIIEGYASIFNSRSELICENGKTFYEYINPKAFDSALQREDLNCLATLNHERKQMLARTKSGTLTLNVDEKGLQYRFEIPKTQLGNDVKEMLYRGDIDSSSFIYTVRNENLKWSKDLDGTLVREVMKIEKLIDVSLVIDPAFQGANVGLSAREYEEIELQLKEREMTENKAVETEIKVTDIENTEENRESSNDELDTQPTVEAVEVVENVEIEARSYVELLNDENAAKERASNETINNKLQNKMTENKLLQGIREALNSQMGGTVISERAAVDGDTTAMAAAVPKYVQELDILGYEPLWKSMGVDLMTGANGTFVLPYESPIVGALVAELSNVTGDTAVPTGILVSPKRFSVQKTFTVETLASATPEFLQSVLADMVKGCDRMITKQIYVKILAGASAVAAGAITKAGFDALQGGAEVETDGAFFANRATFYQAKGVAIDAGSGRFLTEKSDFAGKGYAYDGTAFWYSNLFDDGALQQYVVYGDASRIFVADYNSVEIIIDKYTKAISGQVVITVNKIADVAIKNPAAFVKTPDLEV
jgi:HK97 family phage prohead protease